MFLGAASTSPELPHIFQVALLFCGDLYEAVTVVRPNISEVHSFMLGQPGQRTNATRIVKGIKSI